MSQNTKVVIGINTRLPYANIWEPKSINGGKEKYSVSLIIPKSDTRTVKVTEKAIDAAIEEGIGKFGGKKPNKAALKLPLRDGDLEKDDVNYKDAYFINANSITAPQIVDKQVRLILEQTEVYSGCYAQVSISFYIFNTNGNRGVACGLGNIDGKSLGGHSSASDDFTVIGEQSRPTRTRPKAGKSAITAVEYERPQEERCSTNRSGPSSTRATRIAITTRNRPRHRALQPEEHSNLLSNLPRGTD